ncbi:MAG: hypothetical protein A2351_07460 [Omnitrophica bacterium RIFOXYB12_FULL_50_7]|nr:MAG: hypothetical protein A2351_07460 [Omnitrophica bacterium RIFOXYB12_FULL_50_7]
MELRHSNRRFLLDTEARVNNSGDFSRKLASFIPKSEISVEFTSLIWKTPILAERMNPILFPVALTMFSTLSFTFSFALSVEDNQGNVRVKSEWNLNFWIKKRKVGLSKKCPK